MRAPISMLLIAALAFGEVAYAAACAARSGAHTTVLVELYTAASCPGCAAADHWLLQLAKRYPPQRVLPVALHVDYQDYVSTDRYARERISQRQRRLSMQQRRALVYSPQVLVQGRGFRGWTGGEFDRVVETLNAAPARAQIALEILAALPGALQLSADAQSSDSEARLYVAAYETRLESRVALEWRGPFALGRHQLTVSLLPNANAAHSGALAFVQNHRTTEVLQALMLAACSP